MTATRWRLTVTGTVQGVGFRPHVHRLAGRWELGGHVGNDSAGVFIEVEGELADLESFREAIVAEAPRQARITTIDTALLPPRGDITFAIVASRRVAGGVTAAPPDTVPCPDCVAEMLDPSDRRHRHPFITCTDCGPRFTIITGLPYDRPATTMSAFPLCPSCTAEYRDPNDRRYHAQPVACADCGPRIALIDGGQEVRGTNAVLQHAARCLADGAIVAIKGIGGYHLACRADDDEVVERLRDRKHRPGKPFAVMVRDLEVAERIASVSMTEAALLSSPEGPVVLLRAAETSGLSAAVAPDNPLIGVMMPASPLHHLLLRTGPLDTLVMTSGNLSGEPICIDDDDARTRLGSVADAFLVHDRPIAVACDDSVVRVDRDGALTMIRRSRGWVPTPVVLPFDGAPTLAVGGQLKNTAALCDGRRVWLSPHIGDMGSLRTLEAFERTVERFDDLHAVSAERLAADAHPGYSTRRWALAHAGGRAVIDVQHHHAHIASVMAEHGHLGPVIGVAFDGTGYGPDGTIWGGEIMVADFDSFTRIAHLSPVLLPGGDAAIRHPRRMALSHLRSAGVAWDDALPPVAATPAEERRILRQQLERELNCVPTTSMGRLFDVVASLLDVRHDITYDAQAAIELEVLADRAAGAADLHLQVVARGDGPSELDTSSLIADLVEARREGVAAKNLARGFHAAIAAAVLQVAQAERDSSGLDVVALSGGAFMNELLSRMCVSALTAKGFEVLRHRLVPPNDGGLALGQAAIGSRLAPTAS